MSVVKESDFNFVKFSHAQAYENGEISEEDYLLACEIVGNSPCDTEYESWAMHNITQDKCDYCQEKLTMPMVYYTVKDLHLCGGCAMSLGQGLIRDAEEIRSQ